MRMRLILLASMLSVIHASMTGLDGPVKISDATRKLQDVANAQQESAVPRAEVITNVLSPVLAEVDRVGKDIRAIERQLGIENREPVLLPSSTGVLFPADLEKLQFGQCGLRAPNAPKVYRKCLDDVKALAEIDRLHKLLADGLGDEGRRLAEANEDADVAFTPTQIREAVGDQVPVLSLEEDEDLGFVGRDTFVLKAELGSGGFKTVYSGKYDSKDVAIAVITNREGKATLTPDEVSSMREEIRRAEEIREVPMVFEGLTRYPCRRFLPQLIAYHEIKQWNLFGAGGIEKFFLILELGAGDLNGLDYGTEKHLAYGTAIQLLMGVKCVHAAGYAHKDIKPGNYLRAAANSFIWINDFGLSAKYEGDMDNLSGRGGTRGFKPDERASESKQKYDVYALGETFSRLKLDRQLPVGTVARMKDATWRNRPTVDELLAEFADQLLKPLSDRIFESQAKVRRLLLTYTAAEREVERQLGLRDELLVGGTKDLLARDIAAATAAMDKAANLRIQVTSLYRAKEKELKATEEQIEELESRIAAARGALLTQQSAFARASEAMTTSRREYEASKEAVALAEAVPLDPRRRWQRSLLGPTDGTLSKHPKAALIAAARERAAMLKQAAVDEFQRYKQAESQLARVQRESVATETEINRSLAPHRARKNDLTIELESLLGQHLVAKRTVERQQEILANKREEMDYVDKVAAKLSKQKAIVARAVTTRDSIKQELTAAEKAVADIEKQRAEVRHRLVMNRTPDTPIAELMRGKGFM